MSEEIKTHKGILSFADVFGVTQKQLRMNKRREEKRQREKEKEKNGTWERMDE